MMRNEMAATPLVPKSQMRLEAEQRFSRSLYSMFNQMQACSARQKPCNGMPEPGAEGLSQAA